MRAKIQSSAKALAQEWNGPAFSQYRSATIELKTMKQLFDRLRQAKERTKTLCVVRSMSGGAVQWRSNSAMTAVLDAFKQQRNEFIDPVGAYANVQGGEIEQDMMDAIEQLDFVSSAHAMTLADTREWVHNDLILAQSARIRSNVLAVLEQYETNGRMLMSLDKDDLLRMGLTGPDARMALVALAGLKRRLKAETPKSEAHARQYKLSMQIALLEPDIVAIRELLCTELELEFKQVEGMRKAFMRNDREHRGEILWDDAVRAAATLGIDAKTSRLHELQSTLEPSLAISLDLAGFCRFIKGLLVSAQPLR